MTENEVFDGIHKDCGCLEICNYKKTGCGSCFIKETLIKAEKALEEIQTYRAIGTVEELKSLKESNLTALEMADIWCLLEDLKKYSAIGTIEEFKALKEKNEPKKPIRYSIVESKAVCPHCNKWTEAFYGKVCDWCGQVIDWSE